MNRIRGVVVMGLAGMLLPLAGCGDDWTGFTCGAGTHEEQGVCVPDVVQQDGGQTDAEPPPDAGEPDSETPAVPGDIGAACEVAGDCQSGFCATPDLDPRLVGGYCTVTFCGDGTPCPAGSTCQDPGVGYTACFRFCDPGTVVDRTGYACQPLINDDPAIGIVAPRCTGGGDCPAGALCDSTKGICVAPPECGTGLPACGTGKTCFGGYCLTTCTGAGDCKSSEVCQPTGTGSAPSVCAPPPCVVTGHCPVGAVCVEQHDGLKYCKVPDSCTTTCATGYTCTAGLCLKSCAAGAAGDTACKAIDTRLNCADSFGVCMPACGTGDTCDEGNSCFTTDEVCLPTGVFPGSPCLPAGGGHANPWCLPVGGSGAATQSCVAGMCVPDCDEAQTATGDALCQGISSALTCMPTSGTAGSCVYACASGACPDGFSCYDAGTTGHQNACLPTGSFPSSPCLHGDASHAEPWCLPVGGSGSVTQSCFGGMCVVDCDEAAPQTGNALCQAVNAALTCIPQNGTVGMCTYACESGNCPTGMACYDPGTTGHQNACLPNGTFPFGPCATGNVCDHVAGIPQTCMQGMCVPTCANEGQCSTISAVLTCVEAEGLCFPKCSATANCNPAAVGPGLSCMTSENACLPAGSFPGAPCTANNQCLSIGPVAQTCVGEAAGTGMCAPQCVPGAGGDATCAAVNVGLKCMPMAESSTGGICNYACIAGGCGHLGTGYTCMETYQVCLPTGSFPGSPCKAGNVCDAVGGRAQSCVNAMCVPTCTQDSHCTGIDPGLTCLESEGLCVYACVAGACPDGFTCYDAGGAGHQNACIPLGSAPFYPCKLNGTCDGFGGQTMSCAMGKCVVDCNDGAGGDTVCGAIGTAISLPLVCDGVFTHKCLPACVSNSCAYLAAMGDFTCAPTGQNACLPTGSYPTSPCRTGSVCDSDVGGDPSHNLVCVNPGSGAACYFDCSWDITVCADFTGMGTCTDLGHGSICLPP
jgi:hypothetical protein